ncbi:hypothetical protein H1D32_06905 [Anaerobacillus sp. CMMVII]|uniref:hypothetical protein n=1 Tax=Anaerobacillus sp. CMMVII TaxID=2755588 RepID=UPI0021B7A56F|nr:hypothetical protein [Anaerobacillus sp. CMMVII]MCT8137494.1 hypothetical protein [Anaerobacillus sp. CMMVII]
MINKYIQSQTGGSLILVLFIMLFLSIIGTMLLNQTFYSQQTITKNAVVQAEFYKAEGAIDLMIDEMNNFVENPPVQFLEYADGTPVLDNNNERIPIVRSGPFYYLYYGEPRVREFTIGGDTIEVAIVDIVSEGLSDERKKYDYTLVASLKSSPEVNVTREVTMTTVVEDKTGIIRIIKEGDEEFIYPTFPGNLGERINYLVSRNLANNTPNWEQNSKKPNDPTVTLADFLTFYGLKSIPNNLPNYPNNPLVYNPEGTIRLYNELTGSGGNLNLVIKPGNLTYANKVEFTGCGNSTVEISGVLIANEVIFQGSCNYKISGGIIANQFKIGSAESSTKLITAGGGFDGGGGAGGYKHVFDPIYDNYTEADYQWSSKVDEVLNYETKR